jgi:hypothetical protein
VRRFLALLAASLVVAGCTLIHARDDYAGGAPVDAARRTDVGPDGPPDADPTLVAGPAASLDDAGADARADADAASCGLDAPVHRLVRKDDPRIHLYTASASEIALRVQALTTHVDDGVSFRASATPETKRSLPVYCVRNPGTDDRYYTTDPLARDVAMTRGWTENEGTAFYVPGGAFEGPLGTEGCVVSVEAFLKDDTFHALAATADDRAELLGAGWVSEGIRFYAGQPLSSAGVAP